MLGGISVLILRLGNSMQGGSEIMTRWKVIDGNRRSGCIILEDMHTLRLLLNGVATTKSPKGVNSFVRRGRILARRRKSDSRVFRVGVEYRSDSSADVTGIGRVALLTGRKGSQSVVDRN